VCVCGRTVPRATCTRVVITRWAANTCALTKRPRLWAPRCGCVASPDVFTPLFRSSATVRNRNRPRRPRRAGPVLLAGRGNGVCVCVQIDRTRTAPEEWDTGTVAISAALKSKRQSCKITSASRPKIGPKLFTFRFN